MDKKLEKISVTKRDEAAEVVEKIIDSTADEIILSVPRFSKLTDSLSNFHLIMREAELLHKKVIIESVDDKAIELASLAKLNPSIHFLLSRGEVFPILPTVSVFQPENRKRCRQRKTFLQNKRSAPRNRHRVGRNPAFLQLGVLCQLA